MLVLQMLFGLGVVARWGFPFYAPLTAALTTISVLVLCVSLINISPAGVNRLRERRASVWRRVLDLAIGALLASLALLGDEVVSAAALAVGTLLTALAHQTAARENHDAEALAQAEHQQQAACVLP